MKIVVTGGAGRVGPYIVRELLARGHSVRCLDLKKGDNPAAENQVADLLDLVAVEKAVEGFDGIIHLAAIPDPRPRPQWPDLWRINTISTYNVFEAAARRNVRKVVIASSICAAGFCGAWKSDQLPYLPIDEDYPCIPQEPYSVSKLTNEFTARSFTMSFPMDAICMRLGNIRYPQGGNLGCLACGTNFATITPQDVAQGFRLAIESQGIHFAVYNLTGLYRYNPQGQIESPHEVLEALQTKAHNHPVIRDPEWVFSGKSSFDLKRIIKDLGYKPLR